MIDDSSRDFRAIAGIWDAEHGLAVKQGGEDAGRLPAADDPADLVLHMTHRNERMQIEVIRELGMIGQIIGPAQIDDESSRRIAEQADQTLPAMRLLEQAADLHVENRAFSIGTRGDEPVEVMVDVSRLPQQCADVLDARRHPVPGGELWNAAD